MALPSLITNSFFLGYLAVFMITHIPFDIVMLVKRGKASYPRPSFETFFESFAVIVPTLIFWLFLFINPIIFFNSGKDYASLVIGSSTCEWIIRVIGLVLLSVGLLIGCLGRIGRGAYLTRNESKLTTNWGHAIVRHPSYFMYIAGFIGLPLASLSPYLLILLIGIPGYILTTIHEEEVLKEAFGEKFTKYEEKVGMLFPKIRCKLKK